MSEASNYRKLLKEQETKYDSVIKKIEWLLRFLYYKARDVVSDEALERVEDHLNQRADLWTNIKTGDVYEVISDNVTDATNSRDGERSYLYINVQGRIFVREKSEFEQKFKPLE